MVTGQVSNFQERWERTASQEVVTIWSFRLERQDDQGQPLPRVAVEMRGRGFDGSITPGDWVSVDHDWTPGTTLHANRVTNLSTNSTVYAKGAGTPSKIALVAFKTVVVACVVAIFVWVAIGMFTHP